MKKELKELKGEIIGLLKSTKREGIEDLIDYMEEDYFTSPASASKHNSYEGGLMKHSYDVYTLFKEKNERFKLSLEEETIIIASFLHDLCKAGIFKENEKVKGEDPTDKPYRMEDGFPIGHGEKSVILAQKYIELSDIEIGLIRWHMMHFDPAWRTYEQQGAKRFPAIAAFHTADNEAAHYPDKV